MKRSVFMNTVRTKGPGIMTYYVEIWTYILPFLMLVPRQTENSQRFFKLFFASDKSIFDNKIDWVATLVWLPVILWPVFHRAEKKNNEKGRKKEQEPYIIDSFKVRPCQKIF